MASEHQTCFPADYARLTTLYVSAANWKTNQHRRARFTNFVSKNIREEFLEYSLRSYRWAELERWLTHCLGYDSRKHDIMFAPSGLEDDNAKQLSSAYEWEDLLSDITEHCVVVAWYTEVFLLIMPRDDPYDFRRKLRSKRLGSSFLGCLVKEAVDQKTEFPTQGLDLESTQDSEVLFSSDTPQVAVQPASPEQPLTGESQKALALSPPASAGEVPTAHSTVSGPVDTEAPEFRNP
jgi:hypothetical protein